MVEDFPENCVHDCSGVDLQNLDFFRTFFRGFHKIESALILKALGFPVLDLVIVNQFDQYVSNFLQNTYPSQRFGIRTDRKEELTNAPRGGYIVDVRDLNKYLQEIVKDERVAMLTKMPVGDELGRYDQIYSMNLHFTEENLKFEIVGQGFDGSDLNRGDISPHQVISLPLDLDIEDFSPWDYRRGQVYTCVEADYQKSKEQRLNKIGSGLTEGAAINDAGGGTIERAIEYLRNRGKNLLLTDNEKYRPISYEALLKILKQSYHLPLEIAALNLDASDMIASCSIYPTGKIRYWDIVFPKRKYGSRYLKGPFNLE